MKRQFWGVWEDVRGWLEYGDVDEEIYVGNIFFDYIKKKTIFFIFLPFQTHTIERKDLYLFTIKLEWRR